MSQRLVVYNGVEMVEGWPERIRAAQAAPTVEIAGAEHARIRYGDEASDRGANRRPCPDCKVLAGQLHVPSCDVEQCPACGGQAIGCDCDCEPAASRPFSQREQAVVAARRLYTWRHTGFAADGDATFAVANGSAMQLPYLSIGVRGPKLVGGAWLRVDAIAPGSVGVVRHDCYKDLLRPTEVGFFAVGDPTPATRDRYWEFKRSSGAR